MKQFVVLAGQEQKHNSNNCLLIVLYCQGLRRHVTEIVTICFCSCPAKTSSKGAGSLTKLGKSETERLRSTVATIEILLAVQSLWKVACPLIIEPLVQVVYMQPFTRHMTHTHKHISEKVRHATQNAASACPFYLLQASQLTRIESVSHAFCPYC